MEGELRILILEDLATDAELCARELERAGFKFTLRRVETRGEFERALAEFRPHIVLSDFSMPGGFDGLAALDLTRERSLDLPFVFVSGTIGEDRAVEAMKRGATDYVLKERLARLAPVVERAVQESRGRAARRRAEAELEDTRRRLDAIVSSLEDVVWSYSLRERKLVFASAAIERIFGRPAAEFYAEPRLWERMVHPEDRERVRAERVAGLRAGRFELLYRIVREGGAVRWIQDRVTVLRDAAGEPVRLDGLARDVTEAKLQELKIARLSRMHAMLSGVNAAIVRIRDRERLLEEACRIVCEQGGFRMVWIGAVEAAKQQVRPVAWRGFSADAAHAVSWERVAAVGGTLSEALRTRTVAVRNDIEADPGGGILRQEALRAGCHSTACVPLVVDDAVVALAALFAGERGFFDENEVALLEELAADVSFALQAIARQERLDRLAYYDALTDLPNRSLLLERLAQRIRDARGGSRVVAVLAFDLERFRAINDAFGRHAGDALLKEIGSRLARALADEATVARISADQFALALAVDPAALAHAAEAALARCTGEPFRIGAEEIRISARCGVALYPSDAADAEALLHFAELALRKAKDSGERLVFYAPAMNARMAESLKLENELRVAVASGQFVLHYQPCVELASGRLASLEALIRWRHPERGLVPPAEFIPVLEATGLILEVGHWAIAQALRDGAGWRAAGLAAPRVAVNVSQLQLRRADFVDEVRDALAQARGEHGIDVELTESILMEDVEANIAKLAALKALGVRVAIDDFGTGYSSLAYLARLPIDSLKIDRSFVAQMARGPEQMAIVSTVISLARALNLKVVAEGVETEQQAQLLRLLRCDDAQGYLFGRPLPPAEIAALLRR